jgi:uncharacterized protein (UPF0332 family)
MKLQKRDLINYKIERAEESLNEAKILAEASYWNTAASRLYYAAFYAVNALLINQGLIFKTHSGTKTLFHKHFIMNGKVDAQYGTIYNRLSNLRQLGDYEAFEVFSREEVEPYFEMVESFLSMVNEILKKK